MKKRGLSNVVATVLIVLLALAAVVVVWNFIQPTIESGGQRIDIANKCLQTELEITSCSLGNLSEPSPAADIIVKLERGTPDGFRVVLTDANGQTDVTGTQPSPQTTLETATITGFPLTDVTAIPVTATVLAVFNDNQGEEAFCDESPLEFTCNAFT